MNCLPTNSGAVIQFTFNDAILNRINIIGDETTVFEFDEKSGFICGFTTAASHPMPYGHLKEYFAIKLSTPFEAENGKNAVSLIIHSKISECRIATSFISTEQAKLNFRRETEGKTLEEIKSNGEAEWEKYLSCIDIQDENENLKTVFYTCMYRAYLWPRKFYESDESGKAIRLNMQNGNISEGPMYVDNGFWDTYRTLYPYLSLIDAPLYKEMAEGFYNYYKDSGFLPKWLFRQM